MARNVARNSKKQLGTKNKKPIGASLKKFAKTVNPWGPNVPNKRIGLTNAIGQSMGTRANATYGSATKKPTPAPELRSMQYPKNDPLMWPIEPDAGHTHPPSQSGITAQVRTNVNKSVEDAYTRDGYQ